MLTVWLAHHGRYLLKPSLVLHHEILQSQWPSPWCCGTGRDPPGTFRRSPAEKSNSVISLPRQVNEMNNENIYTMLLMTIALFVGVMRVSGKGPNRVLNMGSNHPLYLSKKVLNSCIPRAKFDSRNLYVSDAFPRFFVPHNGLLGTNSMPACFLRRMLRAKGFSKRQATHLSRLIFPTKMVQKKVRKDTKLFLSLQDRQQALCDLIAHHNHGGIRDRVMAAYNTWNTTLTNLETELSGQKFQSLRDFENDKDNIQNAKSHLAEQHPDLDDKEVEKLVKDYLHDSWEATTAYRLLQDIEEADTILDCLYVQGMRYPIDPSVLKEQPHLTNGLLLFEETRTYYYDKVQLLCQNNGESAFSAITNMPDFMYIMEGGLVFATVGPEPLLDIDLLQEEAEHWDEVVREHPSFDRLKELNGDARYTAGSTEDYLRYNPALTVKQQLARIEELLNAAEHQDLVDEVDDLLTEEW